jgi:polysaccharide export outer membrane protein
MVKAGSGVLACSALATVVMLGWSAGVGAAQTKPATEYQLGAGDELQLNVLQQPSLDRSLTVRQDGTVVLPLAGAVHVAGLTLTEAEDQIRQRLRLFDRDIVDVALTVSRYNSLRVFVLGSVAKPAEYSFQSPPSMWDAVRAAGGLTADANPVAVRVVHQEGDQTSTEIVDLSSMLSGTGRAPDVVLKAGDTIMVPSRTTGGMASAANGVQVFGGVATPGTFPISAPTRLVTVLMLAGGPTNVAQLKDIHWVHDDGSNHFRAAKVDVNVFLKQGNLAGNPLVHPGDTVEVPFRNAGFFSTVWPLALSTLTAVTAFVLARNY